MGEEKVVGGSCQGKMEAPIFQRDEYTSFPATSCELVYEQNPSNVSQLLTLFVSPIQPHSYHALSYALFLACR